MKLIVANWKINPSTQQEAVELFKTVQKGIESVKNVEVVICPPLVYVSSFKFHVSGLALGAQNVFYKEEGAYTGEVSPKQLKDLNVEYVIVGHSESREYLNETNEIINKKVKECLCEGLKPILCVGETREQRSSNKTEEIVEHQLKTALKDVSSFPPTPTCLRADTHRQELWQAGMFHVPGIVIAYEPVWAIGTGKNCSVEETLKSVLFIKKVITSLYSKEIADRLIILYGGSVNSSNSSEYLKGGGVQGLLVGGDSLNAEDFIEIVRLADII
ncbi:MAG: triose-phosphate isomerase [Patescibacteria group bacterium]